MPYANNDGVRIHYHLDGNETGPPLVLQHGFTGSLHNWYDRGYVEALGSEYRLILVDARGHGLSDKPHDPVAYRVALHAADVVAVLDSLGLTSAHFLGYSMGGMIGFALGKHAAERCLSLIIGGDGASERDPDGPEHRAVLDLLRQGPEALIAAIGSRWPLAEAERQRHNDFTALIAYRTLIEQRGFTESLPRIDTPCLIYVGDGDSEHDGAAAAAKLMPHARFVSLPGFSHGDGFTRIDAVLPHIRAFLDDLGAEPTPELSM